MSTHRAEIDWLAIVARRFGAKVDLILDADGRVDEIDVQNLPGMRSFRASPLAMVESLRRVIGVPACAPRTSVLMEEPLIYCYHYDPRQLLAYGDIKSLLQQRIYQGKIADGACFASVETDFDKMADLFHEKSKKGKNALLQVKDPEARARFWCCKDEKLIEVASFEALRSYLPSARPCQNDEGPTP